MSSGLERTVVVGIEAEIDSDDLRQTLQMMNVVAKGKTLPEILESRRDEEMRVRLRGLRLADAVYLGAVELRNGESKDHFHLWGASNMLAFRSRSEKRIRSTIFAIAAWSRFRIASENSAVPSE
jgi:hypothetical protein